MLAFVEYSKRYNSHCNLFFLIARVPDISTKKLKANYAEVIDLIYSGHFVLVPKCYDYGVEEQTSVNFTIQFNFLKILKVVFLNNYDFSMRCLKMFYHSREVSNYIAEVSTKMLSRNGF